MRRLIVCGFAGFVVACGGGQQVQNPVGGECTTAADCQTNLFCFEGKCTAPPSTDAGSPDAGQPDAGPIDAGPADSGPADSGPIDSGPIDVDAGPVDAGTRDAGFDAGVEDAGVEDAGAPDAGIVDAGPMDAGCDVNGCPSQTTCQLGECTPAACTSTSCGAGRVCDGTSCTTPGAGCTSNTDCRDGRVCASGVCQSSSGCVYDADCAGGQICNSGACSTPTELGCTSDDQCRSGRVCTNGTCQSAAAPQCYVDTDCPGAEICEAGTCETAGSSGCTSSAQCNAGRVCSTQSGTCQALPPTSIGCLFDQECASGDKCIAGTCKVTSTCGSNADCALGQACTNGACVTSGCSSDTQCPSTAVCSSGGCVSKCFSNSACPGEICDMTRGICISGCTTDPQCGTGNSCDTSTGQCFSGCASDSDCAVGSACEITDGNTTGTCGPCVPNAVCQPSGGGCNLGAISCSSGTGVCIATGADSPDGTVCALGNDAQGVCSSGSCVSCVAELPCTPSVACMQGATSCSTGSQTCVATFSVMDGTACGASGAGDTCQSGVCTPPSMVALTVLVGGAQTAYIDQPLSSAVEVKLTNGSTAIANAMVTVQAPPNAAANPTTGMTDSKGRFTTQLTLGRATGSYSFGFSATGANTLLVTATATEPPAGTIYPVLNGTYLSGSDMPPYSGVIFQDSSYASAVVAADGTLYFASYNEIFKLDLEGVVTLYAGGGQSPNYMDSGDNGPAVQATFNSIQAMGYDAAGQQIYVADQGGQYGSVIRDIDMPSGTITTVAGGGMSTVPNYGNGLLATQAYFSAPTFLVVGPDSAVYFSDTTSGTIRRVDAQGTGLISSWTPASTCINSGSNLPQFASGPPTAMVFDSAGNAFLLGTGCAGYDVMLRRSAAGVYTYVGGSSSGSGTDTGGEVVDTDLQESYYGQVRAFAIDPAGNFYFGDTQYEIRRIDGATGKVTQVAGMASSSPGGETGDFGLATASTIGSPYQLIFDGAMNLYILDDSTGIRVIQQAGSALPDSAQLSLVGGTPQTLYVDQQIPQLLQVQLLDGTGNPLPSFHIQWQTQSDGAALYLFDTQVDSTGVASVSARPGLLPGAYTYTASFTDLHGNPITGSPVSFTLNATAPASGTEFAILNADNGPSILPGPATLLSINSPGATAADANGNLYLSVGNQILKIDEEGNTTVATTTSTTSMIVDHTNKVLYLTNNQIIEALNLATGVMTPFAGSESVTVYSDDQPATAVHLSDPGGMSLAPDGSMFLLDSANPPAIRKVNASNGVITTYATTCTNNCPAEYLTGITTSSYWFGAAGLTAADSSGNVYFFGSLAGTTTTNGSTALLALSTSGTFSIVAQPGSGSWCPDQLAIDGSGDLYFTDYCSDDLYRVAASNHAVSVVAGNGTGGGPSLDYLPASQLLLQRPFGVSVLSTGHIAVSDSGNSQVRIIW